MNSLILIALILVSGLQTYLVLQFYKFKQAEANIEELKNRLITAEYKLSCHIKSLAEAILQVSESFLAAKKAMEKNNARFDA